MACFFFSPGKTKHSKSVELFDNSEHGLHDLKRFVLIPKIQKYISATNGKT